MHRRLRPGADSEGESKGELSQCATHRITVQQMAAVMLCVAAALLELTPLPSLNVPIAQCGGNTRDTMVLKLTMRAGAIA